MERLRELGSDLPDEPAPFLALLGELAAIRASKGGHDVLPYSSRPRYSQVVIHLFPFFRCYKLKGPVFFLPAPYQIAL